MNTTANASIPNGARAPISGARAPIPGARAPMPGARAPVTGARAPVPGARAPMPGASVPSAPGVAAAGAGATAAGSVRTACQIAKSALFGLTARPCGDNPQTTALEEGGSLVAPGVVAYLICIAFFLHGSHHPVFLAAAAVLGILVLPIHSSAAFLSFGGTAFRISRFLCYTLNGAALAAVLAGVFGFAYGRGGLVCSAGPVGKAFVEEMAKALFILGAFRLGGRTVREYSVVAGAAVGAGFMAFSAVETIMMLPGGGTFFSFARHLPFSHVAATAILGVALDRLTSKDASRKWSAILLALPLLIHVLWAADIWVPWFIKYLVFGFVLWSAVIFLLALQLAQNPGWLSSACFARGGAERQALPTESRSPFASLVAFAIATFFTGFLLTAGGLFFSRVIAPLIGL